MWTAMLPQSTFFIFYSHYLLYYKLVITCLGATAVGIDFTIKVTQSFFVDNLKLYKKGHHQFFGIFNI